MLKDEGIEYSYREYTKEPLSLAELKLLFRDLGQQPSELLRSRDAKQVGLTGDETEAQLMALMAEHPTLLQRPIGWIDGRAVVGRPVEALLELS